jgi:flagellin-like protein
MKGISAIIATLLLLVIAIALAGVVYTFTVGLIPTKAIDIVGVSCKPNTAFYIVVKNLDTRLTVKKGEMRMFVDGAMPTTYSWYVDEIGPGKTGMFNITQPNGTEGMVYRIKVIGPTNEVERSVAC